MKKILIPALLLAVSCNSKVAPVIKKVEEIIRPAVVMEIPRSLRTPNYEFILAKGQTVDPSFKAAVELIKLHGNSDMFYRYMVSKRTYFAHTNKMKVTDAIKKFRTQLDQGETVQIKFYTPFLKGKAIGGWNGLVISENTKFILSVARRAGHIMHETSHKYLWTHDGNSSVANDNGNSFPYALGYDFEDYILSLKPKLAESK